MVDVVCATGGDTEADAQLSCIVDPSRGFRRGAGYAYAQDQEPEQNRVLRQRTAQPIRMVPA